MQHAGNRLRRASPPKKFVRVSISRSLVRREHRGGVQADRDRPAARLRKEGDTTMRFMIIIRASRASIPYLLERWLGLNGDTARRIGHVLSQGGEFAFVMFAMGGDTGT